jgi:hypothetical protein
LGWITTGSGGSGAGGVAQPAIKSSATSGSSVKVFE